MTAKLSIASVLFLSLLVSACAGSRSAPAPAPAPASTAAPEPVPAQMRADADRVSTALLSELKAALEAEMAKGKPAEAIEVCSSIAPALAATKSRETGWQVRRVGTRVRNPLLGTPDAWEQRVLEDFRRRSAAGEALDGMTHAEVVSEPMGRYLRVMRAIPLGAPCVACHGAPAGMSEPLRTAISKEYPHDAATGYAPGELRGAVSVKAPLE